MRPTTPASEQPALSDLVDDRAIEDIRADRLSHAPLARQVSRIAAAEPTPLTIGIFGPWGSGKSSLLRVIRNELRREGVLTVYLDAWRHADLPLARQFVSATAEQLAREASAPTLRNESRGYHRAIGQVIRRVRRSLATMWASRKEKKARQNAWSLLYETRRVRRFRPDSIGRGLIALSVTLIAIAAISSFLAWLVMLIFEIGFEVALERTVTATLGASVLAAIATAVVASSTMDSEQTRPGSEEELVRALRFGQGHLRQGRTGGLLGRRARSV